MLSSKCLSTRYNIHKIFFENNLLINPKPLVGSRGRPTTTKQGRRTGVIENAGGPGGIAIRKVVIFVCISFLFVADCPLLFVLFFSFEIVICECSAFWSLCWFFGLLLLWRNAWKRGRDSLFTFVLLMMCWCILVMEVVISELHTKI